MPNTPQNQQNQKSQNQNQQNQKPQDKRSSGMKEDPSLNDDSSAGNRTSKY